MQNFSYENEFDLHEQEPEDGTHFNVNACARRLVVTQRQKPTRIWLISKLSVTIKKVEIISRLACPRPSEVSKK